MPFIPASPGSVAAFVGIVAFVIVAFLFAVHHAYRAEPQTRGKVTILSAIGLLVWLGGLSLLVGSGRMTSLPLSGLPFFFGGIFVVSIALGVSRLGGRIAAETSLALLVGFQAFRLPLELVLHRWVADGTIPIEMTWTGQNWDIVSGIVALAAAPFANRSRGVAWTANIVGIVLLANVTRVALFCAPLPFGWKVTPPLLVALNLPYALIGPVCVGGAIASHIILTRALLHRSPASTARR